MRKTIVTLVLVLAATLMLAGVPAAQAQTNDRFYFAADFNKWSLLGQAPSTYTFLAATSCIVNPYDASSYVFATTAPVYINDLGTPTNSEIVAVSSVTAGCGFVPTSPAHSHSSFSVQSGTAGLQESLNWLSKTATTPSVVILDAKFYAQAVSIGTTASALISAASGGVGINLVDTTTYPWTWYHWGGSSYTAVSNVAGITTANGASVVYSSISELVTLGGTSYTDSTTNLLPANSIIDAVVARVTTSIVTTTAWELGDASTAARFSGSQTSGQLTAGATLIAGPFAVGTGLASATTGAWQASAAHMRITQTGTPSAGAIRITVFYHQFAAPTS